VQQRDGPEDQDCAGRGLADGRRREQQAEVAVGDPARLKDLAEPSTLGPSRSTPASAFVAVDAADQATRPEGRRRGTLALPKEKPGFCTRRRAFEQVRHGSNIQLLSFSLVRSLCAKDAPPCRSDHADGPLVAANRSASLSRGDDQRCVDDLGGAWSIPGWVMTGEQPRRAGRPQRVDDPGD
jgi:hypothetical protein